MKISLSCVCYYDEQKHGEVVLITSFPQTPLGDGRWQAADMRDERKKNGAVKIPPHPTNADSFSWSGGEHHQTQNIHMT